MLSLDEYISDLQDTSADMLEAYMNEEYKDNKEIKRLISIEIIKHLDLAASSIETKLDELKDKEWKKQHSTTTKHKWKRKDWIWSLFNTIYRYAKYYQSKHANPSF